MIRIRRLCLNWLYIFVQYNHGMRFGESVVFEEDKNRYLYGGKELIGISGMHVHDFTGRIQDYSTMSFWENDPKMEDFYSVSPRLYCKANPIMFVDPTGLTLSLYGSDENVQKTLDLYEKSLGEGVELSIDENGEVSLNSGSDLDTGNWSDSQTLCYRLLSKVINCEQNISLNVVSSSEKVLIGSVKSATIDIDDILALGGDGFVNSIGALFHETYEQYELQRGAYSEMKQTDREGLAHINASRKEGEIVGVQFNPDRNTINIPQSNPIISMMEVKGINATINEEFRIHLLFFNNNDFKTIFSFIYQ